MAKAVKPTTKRRNSSNPVPKKTPAPRGKKTATPSKKIAKDTREDLIAQMGRLLDQVDQIVLQLKSIYWAWPVGKLEKPREKRDALFRRMNMLIPPNDPVTAQDVFTTALTVEPGTIPSIARPGCFVEWIGYVPVLCYWGGFLSRQAAIRVVDPVTQWISQTGYRSLTLEPDPQQDLRTSFRDLLATITLSRDFDLFDVNEHGRDQAIGRLAANEWLRLALDKGPVDPIPLPPRFLAVQQSLFG